MSSAYQVTLHFVQLREVLLNLILNTHEAVSGEGWQRRELPISSHKSQPDEVRITA
jgi:C4-dicarboxylate-specific signal transduction histidine kinase